MSQLSFQYPAVYLLACLLIAIGGALLLYYRSRSLQDRPEWQRFLLAFLRSLSLFLLCLLLMNTILKHFKTDLKKPVIAIAIDQSASMFYKDSSWYGAWTNQMKQFTEALSEKYRIENYYFGARSSRNAMDTPGKKRTDIESSLEQIQEQSDLQLLKAVVLVSDGIYNSGKNPYYHPLCQITPIYTIFHGDSTREKDLGIQRIYHNDVIYSGDKFAIQVDVQAWNADQESFQFRLERMDANQWRTVDESFEKINKNSFFITKDVIIDATAPGIYKYRAVCEVLRGERNLRNNTQQFMIEVLDARKKVLLYAQSPHPDLSAIKNALENNKNYQVDILYAGQPIAKPEMYNLVLFHQLPSVSFRIQPLLATLNANRTARFFILGSQTNLSDWNTCQDVLRINGSGNKPNESQALTNPSFNNFTLSESLLRNLALYPPLNCPFGNYDPDPTSTIALFQRIGKIDTKYPLLLFNDRNGIKTGVLCGDGIWKWKFNEFVQSSNFEAFFELVSKSVQYCSVKDDHRKFKVSSNKKILRETEELVINGELYNDNYERINTPDVSFTLSAMDGKKYEYSLGKKDNYYEMNIGTLPTGDYNFIAKTKWNDKILSAEGKFSVLEDEVELSNLVARPDLLRGMADKSKGAFFYVDQMSSLSNLLASEEKNKPVLFQTLDIRQLIDHRWFLFVLLLLLTAEWFLRRYWGSY